MSRLLILIVLTATAMCGCGVGVNNLTRLKSADLSVGDRVLLQSDAVIYECDPADTASAFWFGSGNKKHCLKSKDDITQYDGKHMGTVPSGTSAVVSKLKFINGVDTTYHLAYLRVSGVDGELVVYGFHFPKLLNLPDVR